MPRVRLAVALALLLAGCGRSSEQQQQPQQPKHPPLPVVTIDPVAVALQAATRSAAEIAFYDAVKWKPQWTGETVAQLRRVVAARGAHALDRADFGAGEAPNGATREAADVARTRAALAYAGALARGAVDPAKVHGIYTLARPRVDLGGELARAMKAGDVAGWIEGLAPQDGAYRALARAYAGGAASDPAPPPAAPAVPLQDGASDARVPGVARRLVTLGYLDQNAAAGDVVTPAIADALVRLRADDATTADDLLRPPAPRRPAFSAADRLRAVAVAMERLRWLERTPAATRIDVNIATARLTYWRGGAIADQREVVVGAPETKTPQLLAPMFRLVANPTWTIPASIVRKDRMAQRSAASLARSGMRWSNGRIVQAAGPRNSLGLVKFDLHDPYAIYLHDTPAKGLFAAAERHRSHGCVRVRDALGFADMIAADAGIAEAWAKARARGRTVYVPLPREIPVRLLYATVLLDANEAPVLTGDPYGWDAAVARRLGFDGKAKGVSIVPAADSGP